MGDMSVAAFGRALLDAGDLDPVYTALWNAGLADDELHCWLVRG